MLHHADSRLLNAFPFSGAESAIAAVNLSQLLLSSTTSASNNPQQKSAATACASVAHSPLNSEGSSTNSTTTTTTNLECSTSIQAPPPQAIHSSVWSEFLNGAASNSFMGDNLENALPTSSSLSSTAPPVTSSGTAVSSWWSGRDQDDQLPAVNWNQTAGSTQGLPDLEGGDWSPGQLGCLPTAPEVNEQLPSHHMAIEHSDFTSTMNTTLVDPDQISGNPASWGSILIGSSGNEEASLDNEAFFSSMKLLNKAVSEPWPEFNPLKSSAAASGFESIDDMMIKQQQQQFSLPGHHLNMDSSTNWSSRAAAVTSSLDVFGGSQLIGGRSKIKQEMDAQFLITQQQQQQQHSMLPPPPTIPNPNNVMMSSEVPSPSRWGAHSSRLPAMLSQVLPSTSKRGGNLFGSGSRSFGNYVSPKAEPALYSSSKGQQQQREQSCSMSQHSSGITSQHSHDSKDSHASKHLMDESREVLSSEPVSKRGSNSSSDHPETFFKRPRIEQQQQQQAAPTLPFKATTFVLQVRKEKLGERITALQQLVAPFGKTDTASVLLEAIGYIKFLHDQVQVLSTPYMKNAVAGAGVPGRPNVVEGAMKGSSSSWAMSSSDASNKSRDNDEPRQDLRSRGLCLVPISCTLQVANDNGADFWTPNIGGGGGGGGVAGGGAAGGGGSAK
ncbi:homeotic protein female sterile isoform X1 [Selaginella moellendorffii]|uniref:homeotic protein female sterile isoform X1 n=1 Tax=Selaginella moellendorffii TaxID=88036 RepID=UPI000D1CB53E|nr:homeotic protein female sterile isoform X1 [Selaginella moellendorffii]|eukprot:XP_024534097.1 homeotic protein female sterile isoform X1 [Selaginella moellendorffii]